MAWTGLCERAGPVPALLLQADASKDAPTTRDHNVAQIAVGPRIERCLGATPLRVEWACASLQKGSKL
jgi:hypothetical protein